MFDPAGCRSSDVIPIANGRDQVFSEGAFLVVRGSESPVATCCIIIHIFRPRVHDGLTFVIREKCDRRPGKRCEDDIPDLAGGRTEARDIVDGLCEPLDGCGLEIAEAR